MDEWIDYGEDILYGSTIYHKRSTKPEMKNVVMYAKIFPAGPFNN